MEVWEIMGFKSKEDCDKHQEWLKDQKKAEQEIKRRVEDARKRHAEGQPFIVDMRGL